MTGTRAHTHCIPTWKKNCMWLGKVHACAASFVSDEPRLFLKFYHTIHKCPLQHLRQLAKFLFSVEISRWPDVFQQIIIVTCNKLVFERVKPLFSQSVEIRKKRKPHVRLSRNETNTSTWWNDTIAERFCGCERSLSSLRYGSSHFFSLIKFGTSSLHF